MLNRAVLRVLGVICIDLIFSASLAAGDLETLQGIWETTIQQNGRQYRAVKTVEGNCETVDVFAGEHLIRRHVVDFEIDEAGQMKIFTYGNGQITIGADAGKKLPDGKFIYQISDDQNRWTGIYGALKGENGPIYIQAYRRVGPQPPKPST
jgi:hypothetical protein